MHFRGATHRCRARVGNAAGEFPRDLTVRGSRLLWHVKEVLARSEAAFFTHVCRGRRNWTREFCTCTRCCEGSGCAKFVTQVKWHHMYNVITGRIDDSLVLVAGQIRQRVSSSSPELLEWVYPTYIAWRDQPIVVHDRKRTISLRKSLPGSWNPFTKVRSFRSWERRTWRRRSEHRWTREMTSETHPCTMR